MTLQLQATDGPTPVAVARASLHGHLDFSMLYGGSDQPASQLQPTPTNLPESVVHKTGGCSDNTQASNCPLTIKGSATL